MTKVELRIQNWIKENMILIAFAAITLISLVIRWSFRDFMSGDVMECLIPWYDEIKAGGFHRLQTQLGDYYIVYQELIWIMTKLPIAPLYCYKLFSIIFDYILAVGIGVLVKRVWKKQEKTGFLLGYSVAILCPTMILNAACWAQCDTMYASCLVWAVIAVIDEKYRKAFILYGLAFSFKFQAIFMMPFFLLIYFVSKKFSILKFLWIPGMMTITSLPALLVGRTPKDIIGIYAYQTVFYDRITLNYPSFWALVVDAGLSGGLVFKAFRITAVLFTAAMLIAFGVYFVQKEYQLNMKTLIYAAFITSYTCVFFLPLMHERYGFIFEVLGIVILVYNRKTIPLWITLIMLTTLTYGNYMFGNMITIGVVSAAINLLIYVSYMILLIRDLEKNKAGEEIYEG